jgi:hypothetical protein
MLQHIIRLGIARSYGRARIRLRPRSPKGIMDMPKIRACRKRLIEALGIRKRCISYRRLF